MPDLFNLNLPTIGSKGTVDQRLEKLEAYLTNLTEQLRFTLANLDPEDNFSTTALKVYTSTSKGEKGNPGKSAYEYAKDQGYEGSETEFAQALSAVSGIAADIYDLQSKVQTIEQSIASLNEDITDITIRLMQAEADITQLKGGE